MNAAAVFGHPDDYRWEGAIVGVRNAKGTTVRTLCAALALAASTLPGSNVAAQRLAPEFATLPEPFAQPVTSHSAAVFGHPDDYRWEGVVIGAVAGGIGGSVFATGMCSWDNPRSTVECALTSGLLGLVFGSVVGGGVGGLVGGLIPKAKSAP